jgi:6-phosphogluconolactonase
VSVTIFEPDVWAQRSAELVYKQMKDVLLRRRLCNVMLTGGRSAKKMYGALSFLLKGLALHRINFYFGDERCLSLNHPDSNYGMAIDTLFSKAIPQNFIVYRMEADNCDLDSAANQYAENLPEVIDILLLGLGEDGHIASLFPFSEALYETNRLVMPIKGPKKPYQRLTITPSVIHRASNIFVLAAGTARANICRDAVDTPKNIDALPARLVLRGKWLLDTLPGGSDC